MRYSVIARVGDPESGSNLASAFACVWLKTEEGSVSNGLLGRYELAAGRLGLLALNLYAPVFRVGEVLVLGDDGRDQFGRKPGKWDVDTEEYDSAEEAFARAAAVAGADQ
jgi:hypothetical protein